MKDFLLEAFESDSIPDQVLEIANKISKELGEEIIDNIGSGSFGFAFSLQSNRVLKITKDKHEINLIYDLSKSTKIPKSLMTYYNIGQIKDTDYFYVLMDYVEPLDYKEKEIINAFYKYKIQYDTNYYDNIMSPRIVKYIREWSDRSYDSEERYETCMMLLPHVREIVKDLKKYNVKSTDFHGENLGWDRTRNRLIMFDLGGYIDNKSHQPKDKISKLKQFILTESFDPQTKMDKWILQIADELGEEIVEFKGQGSFGHAYETESGKILKLTTDPVEIRLAYKLSKNRNWTKYLINYYNVGKTDKKSKDSDGVKRTVYYLLMDKVIPIEDTDVGNVVDRIYMNIIQYNQYYYRDIMNFKDVKEKIKTIYGESGYSQNEIKFELALEIYPHIVNIAKELKKHGIRETDFHSGNIGWSDDHSRLILYDLGGYIDNTTGVKIKNKLKRISLTEESFITKFSNYQNKTE